MSPVSVKLNESQKRLLALVPAGLVFIWVGWLLAAAPAFKKIEVMKTTRSTVGERMKLITEIQFLEKRHQETEELLATEQTRDELLSKLTSLAKASGFVLESLTPNFEPADPYGRLTFDLKAQAQFPLLIRFLDKLESLKPGVAVYKIAIVSGQSWRGGGRLESSVPQLDLTLETYVK